MKKIIFVSVLLAAVCACTKENPSSQKTERGLYQMTISVDADEDGIDEAEDVKSFTYYNPNEKKFKFRWNGGGNEKVSAFDKNESTVGGHVFLTSGVSGAKATLTGSVCDDATGPIVFLNPWQNNTWDKTWNQGKANEYKAHFETNYDPASNTITEVLIPFECGAHKAEEMTDGRLVRVGVLPSKESTAKLGLFNPLSAIYYNLTNCGTRMITRVEIYGNNSEQLAGYCDIDVSTPSAPAVKFFSKPYLSSANGRRVAYDLLLNTGGTARGNGLYEAPLAPVNFTQGLTMKFTDNNGNVAFKKSTRALNIQRNHIKNLGTFDVEALDWHFAVDVRFLNATFIKPSNPFSENVVTTKATVNTQNFALKDGSGRTVQFKTYCPSNGEIGWFDSGLNIKGVGGYLEIPAIDGKVLRQIYLRVSSTGGLNGNPCIVRAEDGKYLTADGTFDADAANADIWTGKPSFGHVKTWDSGFEAGKSYRIQITDGTEGMKIMNLVLVYDDVTRASAISNPQIDEWVPGTEAETIMY